MASEIGDVIRAMREAKGVTQETLARLSDTSLSYIRRLEKNKHQPTYAKLCSIADALGVHPGVFFPNDGEEEVGMRLDPELQVFFSGPWKHLSDHDKNWIRWAIRTATENYYKSGERNVSSQESLQDSLQHSRVGRPSRRASDNRTK